MARVLVTGASGYIGGHLVAALLRDGQQVRVLTRHADGLRAEPWVGQVEVVEGDASAAADCRRALAGVEAAYYLLHSMDGGSDFVRRERDMASTFASAAEYSRVARIVYLGGLHPGGELSEHLGSRVEVGKVFLAGAVPAVVFQAGVVLGAGSASFDMLRHLTERLPAMVAPRWVQNRIQPIAIADVLHYLVGALRLPADVNRTFDIGLSRGAHLCADDAPVCRRRRSASPIRGDGAGADAATGGTVDRSGHADLLGHRPAAGRKSGARRRMPRGRRARSDRPAAGRPHRL